MSDRMIRDELLESKRWLTLKDNADRLAFMALLLKADALGNFNGDPFRLMRLWRDFGIRTEELAIKTLTELVDHDLIRCYEVDGKPLIHIPRFGQRLRYLKRVYPPSPWTTTEQKQALAKNSPGAHTRREEKRSEEVPTVATGALFSASDLAPAVPVSLLKRPPLPRTPAKAKAPAERSPGSHVWDRYAEAYRQRYGTAPVRDAAVNSMMKRIASSLGGEAPDVAAFYVAHNEGFYVRNQHDAKFLLRDARSLRTQWATKNPITSTEARQGEKTQALRSAFEPLIEEAAREALGS